LPLDIVLGIPFIRSFKISLCTPNSTWTPGDDEEEEDRFELELLNDVDLIAANELDEEDIESRRILSLEEESILNEVIREFEELGKVLLGRTNVISHDIDTGDNKPCFTGTRPMSPE